MSIATYEPDRLTIGDLWTWKKSFSGYPASEGWALTYYFSNAATAFNFDAIASNDDYLVSVTSPEGVAAGKFTWRAFVSLDGDRIQVGQGTAEIFTNPIDATSGDFRSHAAKVVEAIEAVIENRATKDQENYSIEGRSLSRTPVADLLVLRDRYRLELQQEKMRENFAKGRPGRRTVKINFRG